ncbi:nuclear pore protein [Phlyctema vagabunda]|uniref:Nuclear pore protein n=1 Tax=Phlyctema vagabunda TaxID=108571 RepID=A0ABR4PYJ6_9HELO
MDDIFSPAPAALLHAPREGFALLQNTHRDMIQATAFNSYGDRFATSSVDGKIKVYNRHRDGSWNLCDTWGAHSGEVIEIHWLPPTIHPNLLASIATDGRFKLWVEDPTIAPQKGRRFSTALWELRSPSRQPFTSFSLTHNAATRHTYLALINRSGTIHVYENDEPENLSNWTEIDKFRAVSEEPARGDETAFKLQFDRNLEPCYNAVRQGVPRDALGLVVAGMNTATVWRTKELTHTVSLGSSNSKEFYLAVDLKGHRGLVRDVAWAPGSIRGFDIVATACKDGYIRVFEISTPTPSSSSSSSSSRTRESTAAASAHATPSSSSQHRAAAENGKPSGIGAGLAGAREGAAGAAVGPGQVKHVAREVSRLDAHRSPVWRVDFDDDGQLLGSTGDDGRVLLWRREPSGIWSKSSELAMNRSALPAAA